MAKALALYSNRAVLIRGNGIDARLIEVAENLHRSDLTPLERAEHIAEWIRLTDAKGAEGKPAHVAPVSNKGGRGKESGINAASRELGIERTEAQGRFCAARHTASATSEGVGGGGSFPMQRE